MKKKIYLIGLNLYSIFLSLKIKKDFKNIDIHIMGHHEGHVSGRLHICVLKRLRDKIIFMALHSLPFSVRSVTLSWLC